MPVEQRPGPRARTRTQVGPLLRDELSRLQILQGVDIPSIEGIVEQCTVRNVAPGEALLTAGETNRTMYMILDGRLSVHLEAVEHEPVAFIEAGQTVGELSVIDHRPATAFVVAQRLTRLVAVDEEAFWRLVTASHALAKNLLQLLAQRMRATNVSIAENVRLRQRFEHDALADGLTGLFNRRWLDERLPRIARRHARDGRQLSLMMLDVDHFKRFNDDHGHAAGDLVLVRVAELLQANLRPDDFGVRYGGEEFVVILPGSDVAGARAAAERIRAEVAAERVTTFDGATLPPVTISIGVARSRTDEPVAALLQRADAALYRAKDSGRDRVEVG